MIVLVSSSSTHINALLCAVNVIVVHLWVVVPCVKIRAIIDVCQIALLRFVPSF